jgi:hypothetical protein
MTKPADQETPIEAPSWQAELSIILIPEARRSSVLQWILRFIRRPQQPRRL